MENLYENGETYQLVKEFYRIGYLFGKMNGRLESTIENMDRSLERIAKTRKEIDDLKSRLGISSVNS